MAIDTEAEWINSGVGWRRVTPSKDVSAAGIFKDVPIIDLAEMNHPEPSRRIAVAKQIYDACVRSGFFYVKNHGVPDDLVGMVFGEATRFFNTLSLEEKMKLHMDKNEEFYGYLHIDLEKTNGMGYRSQLHESMNWGYDPISDPLTTDTKDNGINFWPPEDSLPEFKHRIQKWMGAMLSLSRSLLHLFALGLDLQEDYFDAMVTRPGVILRMNHYPSELAGEPETPASIRPHTDYELFTILAQDDVKSLQVVSKDGSWIPVDPIPGTFVVNIGDAMSLWTNGLFVSTMHKAQNFTKKTRYSIPYFFGANYDTVLEAIPTCVSPERPAMYMPITQRDYVHRRLNGAYPKPNVTVTYETIEIKPEQGMAQGVKLSA